MGNSPAFDWVCNQLEERTSLNRLEARGTVRLALKESGLDPGGVTADQMQVVTTRVLPNELDARGVENASALCSELAIHLGSANLTESPTKEGPDAIFDRLGS